MQFFQESAKFGSLLGQCITCQVKKKLRLSEGPYFTNFETDQINKSLKIY
jgi:hypothetical protein